KKHRRTGVPPSPIAPEPDAQVDAQALTFEWEGGDAGTFVVEVARRPDFQDLVAQLPTASSTSVTIYDLFRPDGTRYYWRVSTPTTEPSAVQSFVAATYEQLTAASAETGGARARGARTAVAPPKELPPPVSPPYRSGVTGGAEM